ncbi:MAG: hypothetical protein K2G10_05370, partial [Alistipes sp.]|nr:hypothetical protein [Alistipes sp.]
MQKAQLLLTIFAFVLCLGPMTASAQGGGKIQVGGIVTAAEDHQPLIGVNLIAGAPTGGSTLADGS